jgi:hypothetical protein
MNNLVTMISVTAATVFLFYSIGLSTEVIINRIDALEEQVKLCNTQSK